MDNLNLNIPLLVPSVTITHPIHLVNNTMNELAIQPTPPRIMQGTPHPVEVFSSIGEVEKLDVDFYTFDFTIVSPVKNTWVWKNRTDASKMIYFILNREMRSIYIAESNVLVDHLEHTEGRKATPQLFNGVTFTIEVKLNPTPWVMKSFLRLHKAG